MAGIPTDIFGAMIRARRKALGWSQEELAEQALGNRDRKGHISQIETTKLRHVSDEDARKLARALQIDPSEIERLKALGDAADGPSAAEISADLDRLASENGSLREALDNLKHLTHDGLIALATRFGIADAHRLPESALRAGLADKAEEYSRYRAQIEHIDERVAGLGNLKAAARDAADRLDFEEVEALLSRVDQVETEIAAQTKELRADNFLLQGRTQEAFDVLSAAADSFGGIDRLEPARRKVIYQDRLYEHGLRYGGEGLRFAAAMLTAALGLLLASERSDLWANIQVLLGNALTAQGSSIAGDAGAALLAEAVTGFRAALKVYSRSEHPQHWAATQNSLGSALRLQGTRTDGDPGAVLLAEAITSYLMALEVWSKYEHPLDWATAQNNLGNVLAIKGQRTSGAAGTVLLAGAVVAFRAALEVYTKTVHPLDWAMTQTNLANTLLAQGQRTAGAATTTLIANAVTACRSALEVYTKAKHPLNWATAQSSLGNALSAQANRTAGAELWTEAGVAYRVALESRPKSTHPLFWAMTHENLAIMELERSRHDSCSNPLAHLNAALMHVDEALTIYDPLHTTYDNQTATALRARIFAALEALQPEPEGRGASQCP